jgi:4-amino-4-deoxy-L-arabinose transferase-like glycosyltransferase
MKIKPVNRRLMLILFLCALLVSAFIVRIWPMRYAYWWDETVYLQNADTLLGAQNYNEFDVRPPVISIVIAGVFLLWHHPFAADIMLALLSALAAPFICLAARELYGDKTAVLAGLIAAFTPILVQNGHYIMSDAPAVTLSSASFYFLLRSEKGKRARGYALSGSLAALSALTKFTNLLFGPLFILYLFSTGKDKPKKVAAFFSGFCLVLLPYLVWAQVAQGSFLSPFTKATQSVAEGNEPWTFYFLQFVYIYPLAVGVGCALRLFEFALGKKPNRKELFLALWAFLFMAYLGAATPYKEARYILPITLPAVIISARAFGLLLDAGGKKSKAVSLAIIGGIFFISFQSVFSVLSLPFINVSKTDEMKLSDHIKNKYSPEVLIYSNQNYPVYAYYTKRKVIRLLQEDESFYSTYNKTMNKGGLLIVYPGVKKPSAEWLDANPLFRKETEISGIVLYEYNPR